MIPILQTEQGAALRAHLDTHRVIAIVRADAVADPVGLAAGLSDAGIGSLEFTLTTPGALESIAAVAEGAPDRCRVGVGTVVDPAQVAPAVEAGAGFVVTPAPLPSTPEIAAECRRLGIGLIAGAMTPGEIVTAAALADLVKIFPARSLGPRYLSDVLAPLEGLALVPSGGIALDEVADYLAAGAAAVGVGSLMESSALRTGDHAVIFERARRLMESLVVGGRDIDGG